MTEVLNKLFEINDESYADFQAKLTPTLPRECFIGVRVPVLRKFAAEFGKTVDYVSFMSELPHKYYDENMLHALLITQIKDYERSLAELERFLPYVDNWAVCDIMSPKAFKKNKDKLIFMIKEWTKSSEAYTIRFGVEMLMSHYLDEDFLPEYLEIPAKIVSEEYYVNMMLAWFYSTALVKQWDATIPYLEEHRFGKWVNNKTIQKAIESYRISEEQKTYLRGLKL